MERQLATHVSRESIRRAFEALLCGRGTVAAVDTRTARRPPSSRLGYCRSNVMGEDMKLGLVFTLNAVIAIAFGVAFVIVPSEVLAAYGVTLTPGTALVARLFGAALVGFGVISWFARSAAPSEAVRAIVLGFCIDSFVGCVVALQGQLAGTVNALGWSTVVLYGFFAVAYAFAFRELTGAKRA
jgi:hypothetical protein